VTSAIEFQSGVDKLVANLDIADKLVNTDADVTTGAGVRPSFPKVLREFVDLGTARDEAVAAAEDAVVAADKLTLPSLTYVGRPGDAILVDGTAIGIGATFWRDAVAEDGSLIAIDLFDKAAGTLNLAVYRGAVTALTRVALTTFATTGTGTSRRITLAAPILVQAGDILAVQSPTTGTYAEGQYATDRAGYTFTGPYLPETVSLTTPPAANTQMQVRFVISYRQSVVTAERFLVAEANAALAGPAAALLTVDAVEYIGRPGDATLEEGDPASIGAVYWRDLVDHEGSFASLELFDRVAGTIRVAVYRGAATALQRIALTNVTTIGSGTVRTLALPAAIAVKPGDIIALQPSVEGALRVAQVQSGDTGYNYSFPDLPTTMSLGAPTTNGQLQVRFRINYRNQVVTAASLAALQTGKADAVLKISSFAALCASTSGPYELSWSIDSVVPKIQRLTWNGWSIDLDGKARRVVLPVNWATPRPVQIVSNSMGDGNDAEAGGNWSGIYAGLKNVALINPAKYSQDATKQALRVGATDIFLTVLNDVLPAGGGSVAVTAINGVAPGPSNPNSFLNTFAGDPVTPNNTITGMAAGRHVTIAIPNGGSSDYFLTVDAGQTSVPFPAGTQFIPDFAASMASAELHIDVGRINFYPAQPILDLVTAMVGMARGNPVTVWPTLSADTDSETDRAHMRAFNAAQAALWPTLTPRVVIAGVTYDLLAYLQYRASVNQNPLGNVPGIYHKPGDPLHFNTLGNSVRADFARLWDQQRAKPPAVTGNTQFTLAAYYDGVAPATAVAKPSINPTLADFAAKLDGIATNSEYFSTLSEAVAKLAIGAYFVSRDVNRENVDAPAGVRHQYQRISGSPFWDDLGPVFDANDIGVDPTRDVDKPVSVAQAVADAQVRADALAAVAGSISTYDTIAKLQDTNVPAGISAIELRAGGPDGYGGGIYLPLTSALPKPGVRMSKDGQTWKLKASIITPQHFGGRAGAAGEYDTTAAMIEAMMFAAETDTYTRPNIWLPAVGIYKFTQPIGQHLSRGLQIVGAGGQDATRVNVALDANTVLFENGVFNPAPGNPYNKAPTGIGIKGIYFDHGAQSAGTTDGTRTRTLIQNNGGSRFSLDDVRAYGFKYVYASPYGADYSDFNKVTGVFNDAVLYLGPGANQITGSHIQCSNGRDGIIFDRAGWGIFSGSNSFVGMSRSDIAVEYYAGVHPEGPGTGYTRFGVTDASPGYPGHSQNFVFVQTEHESNNQNDGRGPQQHVWCRSDTAGYPALLHIMQAKLVAGKTPDTASDLTARFWRNENGTRGRIDTLSYYGDRLSVLFQNVTRDDVGDVYPEDGSTLPTVFAGGFSSEQSYTQRRFNRGTFGQAISTILNKIRVVGDAAHRWAIRADGRMEWGPGGTVPANAVADTFLGRYGPGSLETGELRPTTLNITDSLGTLDKIIARIGASLRTTNADGTLLVTPAGMGYFRFQKAGSPVSRVNMIGINNEGAETLTIDPGLGRFAGLSFTAAKTALPNRPASGWAIYTDATTGKLMVYGDTSFGTDAIRGLHMSRTGSKTYAFPGLAAGARTTTTVTVAKAGLGDIITGWSYDNAGLAGLSVTVSMTGAETATFVFVNESAAAIPAMSGILRADASS
jgi:hypothetical protein